jgi:predicted nuclease with TOPRIM domain
MMPELYGQPRKDELRKQIRELQTWLWREQKENRELRDGLLCAQCKIAALEEKIQRIEQKAREILAEAAREIKDETWGQRLREARKREIEARIRAVDAEIKKEQGAAA